MPEEKSKVFKKENNLLDKFILYLGKLEPRKNIVGLIKAFDVVKRNIENKSLVAGNSTVKNLRSNHGDFRDLTLIKNGPEFKNFEHKNLISNLHLVIIGSRGWLDEEIFETADSSPNRENIIFKDTISNKLRAGYYSSASVFVYPLFFEGFGFPPPLEAMACGTPVVTSFNSSLPEIAGEPAIYISRSYQYI